METILSCVNVTKEYPWYKDSVHALSGITIDIKDGDFISFMGPSGSGKTTLLNILGLLDIPTSGELSLNGKSTLNMNLSMIEELRRDYYGFVFQRPNLIKSLSIYRNIELPLLIQKKIKQPITRKEKIFELLKLEGLEEKANKYPSQLSLGQQQRIALARAIVHEPKILLLDEPTGSLDRENSNLIVDLLKRIHESYSSTIIIVTHDDQVAKTGNSIRYLENGKLLK